MALTSLRDLAIEPYAEGRRWDAAGEYEWVSAIAEFAADPTHASNARIADLALAARHGGAVTFDADLRLLRPTSGGNGRLLLLVPNRGLYGGVPFSLDAPLQFGTSEIPDPGDGFLLKQGWTIAWCGWQWDVVRTTADRPGGIGLTAPVADVEPGWMRVEFRPDVAQATHSLSDSSLLFTFQDYPTADVDDPLAVLTEMVAPDGEPAVIDRSRWRFVDERTVALDGGFEPFHWYTLTYRSGFAPVAGTGLLAVRDATAWLRREHGFDHAFAYGVSQSGRLLRQFLFDGLNLDETGNVVFDGVFAHIAGGRRGEFNHRYAQPSLTHALGFSNVAPYDTAALLAPQRARGGLPKLMLTNSSWEYWRGDGALVHADPETGADLPDDPDARAYLLRGTDHIGAMPIKDLMPIANPVHDHDISPVLRALFVALVEWVCSGTEPPPSAVPRWAEGTAALRPDVLMRFAAAGPDVRLPDLDALNVTREIDLGPDVEAGIGRWPYVLGAARPAIVSAVDESGNELAGVALPVVAAPLAAYTGWNPRRPVEELPNPLYEFVGSRLPRLDGRGGPDRLSYETAARVAAATLVAGGLLLSIDVERTVREALAVYDLLTLTSREG